MKVYRSIEEFTPLKKAVLTTGTFDGVHLGHRKIISRLIESAGECGGETVILTFFPHPRMVLHPDDHGIKLINTTDEKIALLENMGIDHFIEHPFTKHFSRLTAVEYVRDILVKKLGTKRLVIGYNHQFGRNREGSFENLKELSTVYNFQVEEIPRHEVDQVTVSSTQIRNALLSGEVRTAAKYLGYPYLLSGTIVAGDRIGRTIDFPTANIKPLQDYKLIPAEGVYAVQAVVEEKTYKGMLYIGKRPTVGGTIQVIEVNLFDFNSDIYDKTITIRFIERIRGDKKLNGIPELKIQLTQDREEAIKILT